MSVHAVLFPSGKLNPVTRIDVSSAHVGKVQIEHLNKSGKFGRFKDNILLWLKIPVFLSPQTELESPEFSLKTPGFVDTNIS